MITKVADKKFVGKDIIYAHVWKKGDKRKIYHLIYQDGRGGQSMMKRFYVNSITRDTEYDLTKGSKGVESSLFFRTSKWGKRGGKCHSKTETAFKEDEIRA